MSGRLPYLTSRLQGFGTTIFSEMTALAVRHDAINLGQGFPDTDGPEAVLDAAVAAIRKGHNQYAPGIGIPALRTAVAEHQRRHWGLTFDPDTEVTVTTGATEALTATILALCEVGDEVIVFEPWYDSYAANIAMAGAVRVSVPLRAPTFAFDPDQLRRAVTAKTRLIVVNSPHNPTGAVFGPEQLAAVADVARRHDLVVVTDEVYEHLVFEGRHLPVATLPGMRERTVTISSAGKTFSCTGWKVGWLCAAPPLTAAVRTAKQYLSFTSGTPFQHAVVAALGLDDTYYERYVADYRSRRDRLVAGLRTVGMEVSPPAGTYFVTADIRPLGTSDGVAFCRALPARAGVVAGPTEVFYDHPELGRPLVRFAFCKREATLDEGIRRLQRLAA